MLGEQGRITELANPRNALSHSEGLRRSTREHHYRFPDNRSRQLINQAVRVELQASGALANDSQEFRTLTHRSDMTAQTGVGSAVQSR